MAAVGSSIHKMGTQESNFPHNFSFIPHYIQAMDLIMMNIDNDSKQFITSATSDNLDEEASTIEPMEFPDNETDQFSSHDDTLDFNYEADLYIFHEPRVKIPLLIVYTVVFVLAFFGEYTILYMQVRIIIILIS